MSCEHGSIEANPPTGDIQHREKGVVPLIAGEKNLPWSSRCEGEPRRRAWGILRFPHCIIPATPAAPMPLGARRKKFSVPRLSPRYTKEPAFTRSLGLARRGQLIFLDVLRIASWILGTSVLLKKGPSAKELQVEPHSKTCTRALLGPCAPAFCRCAVRRRRRSRRRCG